MNNLIAKGGGCFLAGTPIETEHGFINVEDIKPGDRILSYNEHTGKNEIAKVGSIDIIKSYIYYVINGNLKVTGSHPFYTSNGLMEVKSIYDSRDDVRLYDIDHKEVHIASIVKFQRLSEFDVYNLIDVSPNHNYYAGGILVHNKGGGGGRASSSARSSSSSRSSSSTKSNTSISGKTTVKAGSSVKAASGKTVKTTAKTPTSSKYKGSTAQGVVGVDGYTPKFKNNYSAPEGSMIYYPNHSFSDYFFWYYLFNQNSPAHDNAVVMQPDGKEVPVMPEKGGDGMAVFNWILMIVFIIAIIGGIVWCVDKATVSNEEKERRERNKNYYRWL